MPRHGINGQIWIDTSAAGTFAASGTANLSLIASKNKWTFDASRDFVEVTSFGDTSKNYVAGLANAAGDISGFWVDSGTGTLISTATGSSTERALIIIPDVVNDQTSWIAGKAFFSKSLEGGVAEAVAFNIHYQAGPSGITGP